MVEMKESQWTEGKSENSAHVCQSSKEYINTIHRGYDCFVL
jgi:hypothetical protein